MFEKRGKRGISPLIATVLLIAFAVSIGTMIMNWNRDSSNSGGCNDVNISIQTMNGQPMLCYDTLNTNINMVIKNNGETDVDALKLLVTGVDFSHEEKMISDSRLPSGNAFARTIPYIRPGAFKVEIAPVIKYAGKEKVCLDKAVGVESIPSC